MTTTSMPATANLDLPAAGGVGTPGATASAANPAARGAGPSGADFATLLAGAGATLLSPDPAPSTGSTAHFGAGSAGPAPTAGASAATANPAAAPAPTPTPAAPTPTPTTPGTDQGTEPAVAATDVPTGPTVPNTGPGHHGAPSRGHGHAWGRDKHPAVRLSPTLPTTSQPTHPPVTAPAAVEAFAGQPAPQAAGPGQLPAEVSGATTAPTGPLPAAVQPVVASSLRAAAGVDAGDSAGHVQPASAPTASTAERVAAARPGDPQSPAPPSGSPIYMASSSAEAADAVTASPDRRSHESHADAPAPATAAADVPVTPATPPIGTAGTGSAAPAPATAPAGPVSLTPASATALQQAVRVVASTQAAAPTVSHVVLRLDPPGIGTIALRLVSHAGAVSVAIRTDTTDAANAIASTRDQVLQALMGHGLTLGDVRVSSGGADTSYSGQPSSSGQTPADTNAPGGGGGGSGEFTDPQSHAFASSSSGTTAASDDLQRSNGGSAASRPRREGTWL
ncbi:MAG TPA: flagellar hook-length control protein FliK [Mycobacteriales bacterium]|nr:flagellar hook-length control protein FliK [Mycobacteriales bacterium]